ncbi:hypothetical protein PM082_004027 [Marasmius tenuissimus]|nr:hypothetical protein PM082_004027 [Marasmius tenuissimus]
MKSFPNARTPSQVLLVAHNLQIVMGVSNPDTLVLQKLRAASNLSSGLDDNIKDICGKVCSMHASYAGRESVPGMTDLIRRSCEAVYTSVLCSTSDLEERITDQDMHLLRRTLDRINELAEQLNSQHSLTNLILKSRYKSRIEKDDKVLCNFIVEHSLPFPRAIRSPSPACPRAESTRTRSKPHTPIPSPSHSTYSLRQSEETPPPQVSRDPSVRTLNSSHREVMNHPCAISSETTLEGSVSSSSDHDPPQVRIVDPQGVETDDEGWGSEAETTISCGSTQPRFKADDDIRKRVLNKDRHVEPSLYGEGADNHSHLRISAGPQPSSTIVLCGHDQNETTPTKTVRQSPSTTLTRKSLAQLRKKSSSLSRHFTRGDSVLSGPNQDSEPPQVRIVTPHGVEIDESSQELEGEKTIRGPVTRPRIKTGDDILKPMPTAERPVETTILKPIKTKSPNCDSRRTSACPSTSSVLSGNEIPLPIACPRIETEDDIRGLLNDKQRCAATLNSDLPSHQAQLIANFLHKEIQASECPKLRKKYTKYLRLLFEKIRVLPECLFLNDIKLAGDVPGRPIGGGGFSDVYKGSYNDKEVCLKVLRVFIQDGADRTRMTMHVRPLAREYVQTPL